MSLCVVERISRGSDCDGNARHSHNDSQDVSCVKKRK